MNLIDITPIPGSKKLRKRIGRGTGNGRGKTCGRGNKGQKSRSGGKLPPWFEGGQMPLYRRIPKRGFKSLNKIYYNIINVDSLKDFKEGDKVDTKALLEKGLIKRNGAPVKLLANGELAVKGLKIEVCKCSAAAKEKVEKAGGTIELIK